MKKRALPFHWTAVWLLAMASASCGNRSDALKAEPLPDMGRASQIESNQLVPPAQKTAVLDQMKQMQTSHPPSMK